jgi:hypothetical protein
MSRICVGAEHACVIGPDSSIQCWGRCTEGQCTPPEEPFVLYRQISCSDYSTCAVDNDDVVRCWGSDLFGVATPPAVPLSLISMGSGHACGIARNNSRVLCWGWNDLGQTDVPFNLTATAVASSRYHSCALDVNFGVVCWGANRNNAALPPSFLAAEGRFSGSFSAIATNLSDVATSLYHSCVLGAHVNFLACWGAEGMTDGRADVPTGLIAISVSTGLQHTCATNFNNAVQCFGDETAFGVAPTARCCKSVIDKRYLVSNVMLEQVRGHCCCRQHNVRRSVGCSRGGTFQPQGSGDVGFTIAACVMQHVFAARCVGTPPWSPCTTLACGEAYSPCGSPTCQIWAPTARWRGRATWFSGCSRLH